MHWIGWAGRDVIDGIYQENQLPKSIKTSEIDPLISIEGCVVMSAK